MSDHQTILQKLRLYYRDKDSARAFVINYLRGYAALENVSDEQKAKTTKATIAALDQFEADGCQVPTPIDRDPKTVVMLARPRTLGQLFWAEENGETVDWEKREIVKEMSRVPHGIIPTIDLRECAYCRNKFEGEGDMPLCDACRATFQSHAKAEREAREQDKEERMDRL